MAQVVTKFNVKMPQSFPGITAEAFWQYLSWKEDKSEINKRIKKPFEAGLTAKTGFDDQHRPSSETKTTIEIPSSELIFSVTSKPTTKRPSYSEVNESFGAYVDFLAEQHSSDIRRKGVRTFDDGGYISIDDLQRKIQSDLGELLSGREGVSHSICFEKPTSLASQTNNTIPIVFNRNYRALTDFNGRAYVVAGNFIAEGDERVNPFKERLLQDSLDTLEEQPNEPVVLAYAYEGITFNHQLEPRQTPKHKAVIDAFTKKPPKRLTKKSTIGDFEKLQLMQDQEAHAKLTGYGLIDCSFIDDYQPKVEAGNVYASIEGVQKRLAGYRETLITPGIEQNISIRPK